MSNVYHAAHVLSLKLKLLISGTAKITDCYIHCILKEIMNTLMYVFIRLRIDNLSELGTVSNPYPSHLQENEFNF